METNDTNKINFLDYAIKLTTNNIGYSINRKPTQTDNIIQAESNHPKQHKHAAINSLLYRLENTPMKKEDYWNEYKIIQQIAANNGYTNNTIRNMHNRIKEKIATKFNTSREQEKANNETKWSTFTYTGAHVYKITKLFKKHNIKIAFRTDNNLINKLKTPTETKNKYNQSGVYQIECKDCHMKYIGQTGRNITSRHKEHIYSYRNNKTDSNYASHLLEHRHEPGTIEETVKILKTGNKGRKLNVLENMEIYKAKNKERVINVQINNISDTIFTPLRQPRTTPT